LNRISEVFKIDTDAIFFEKNFISYPQSKTRKMPESQGII